MKHRVDVDIIINNFYTLVVKSYTVQ